MSRLLREHCRSFSLAVFLGFGLVACTGGDTEEPVQSDGEQAEQTEQDEQTDPTLAEQATAEGEPAAVDATLDTPEEMPTNEPPASDAAMSDISTSDSAAVDAPTNPEDSLGSLPAMPTEGMEDTTSAPSMQDTTLSASDVGLDQTTGAGTVGTAEAAQPKGKKGKQTKTKKGQTVASGESGSYAVQAGDTLGKISTKIYGTKTHWQALADANGLQAPYVIFKGKSITFPILNEQAKNFAQGGAGSSSTAGAGTVTVKRGDTLSGIASTVWGAASKWPRLYEMNKDKIADPNKIEVGLVLVYGASESANVQPTAAPAPKKSAVNPAKKTKQTAKKAPVGKNAPVSKKLAKKKADPLEKPAAQVIEEKVEHMNKDAEPETSAKTIPASTEEANFDATDEIPIEALEKDIDDAPAE